MSISRNRTVRRVLATLALAVAATAGLIVFGHTARSTASLVELGYERLPLHDAPVQDVPVTEASAFSALHRPDVASIPERFRQLASTGPFLERFAANPALARAVVAPDGNQADPWFVVPGDESVCLLVHGNFGCQTLSDAIEGRLYVIEVTPVGKHAVPPPGTPAHMTVVGLVPDDVTAVSAASVDGGRVQGDLKGNAFKISGTDLVSMTLERTGKPSITTALLKR